MEGDGVLAGNRIVYIPERNLGIGALQPEGVALERDAQNDVVGLGGRGEVAEHARPLGVNHRVVGGDAALRKHGLQVVAQRLAVAELRAEDLLGRHGLQPSDAELDAYVAGRFTQIVVERPDLFARCAERVGASVHLGPQLLGQQVAPFEQAALPAAVALPVLHAALRLLVFEPVRHGVDDGHEVDERRRGGFAADGRPPLQPPAVGLGLLRRVVLGLARTQALPPEGGVARERDGVASAEQRRCRAALRQEDGKGQNSVPVGDFMLEAYRVAALRDVDLQVVDGAVLCQAGTRVFGILQVRALELADEFSLLVVDCAAEAAEASRAVGVAAEVALRSPRFVENRDFLNAFFVGRRG